MQPQVKFAYPVYSTLFLALLVNMAFGGLPSVTTLSSSEIRADDAILNGSVNPNGDTTLAWFEWGATTNYGSTTPAQNINSNSPATNFSQIVTGLTASSTYHFRAMASNSFGLAVGANQNFTTPVFTEIGAGLTPIRDGSVAWGDYDNDGRLDLLIAGWTDTESVCQIWRNTGQGFTNVDAALPPAASAAWIDFDNDSQLDIWLRRPIAGSQQLQLWRNTGAGFLRANVIFPPGSGDYSFAFGDYDNDGRVDVLVTGYSYSLQAISQVWRNTGAGFTTNETQLPGAGSGAWGDFNNDGRLDILIGGGPPGQNTSQVWLNTGAGFTNVNAGLPGYKNGSVAWCDFDNDGRLDVLLAGEMDFGPFVFRVWRNTGTGFTPFGSEQGSPWYAEIAVGDYDNDGRTDVLLTSRNSFPLLYRNDLGAFVRTETGLPEFSGKAAWGDFDNDGRLDLAIVGRTMGPQQPSYLCQVWKNRLAQTNSPPTPPQDLTVTAVGNTALLSWSGAGDTETPASGLTYNLRVGTTLGGLDVVSPVSLSTGVRMIPQPGNRQQARASLFNVPLNQTLYWSVQAVDSAFAGSAFAPESSFRLNGSFISTNYSFLGDLNRDGVVDATEFNLVLSNYFRTNPPAINSVTDASTNAFQFEVTNLMNLGFTVLATTNVALPVAEWESIGPAALLYRFVDPVATNYPTRFYQLRWP